MLRSCWRDSIGASARSHRSVAYRRTYIKVRGQWRYLYCAIEIVHMMREGQAKYACTQQSSLAEQFERLAA